MKKLLTILILLCSLSSFGQFGLFQAHNRAYFQPIKYGYLYNWYAVGDARGIANTGWHVPSTTEYNSMLTYIGGTSTAATYLREPGTEFWETDKGDNSYGFNLRGNGQRDNTGSPTAPTYKNINFSAHLWTSTPSSSFAFYFIASEFSYPLANVSSTDGKRDGRGVRLIADDPATGISDGTEGTYTGNDGTVYRTVAINETWWLADNLIEKKYQNGDPIPEVTDSIVWSALTTGARCVYGNDENNR